MNISTPGVPAGPPDDLESQNASTLKVLTALDIPVEDTYESMRTCYEQGDNSLADILRDHLLSLGASVLGYELGSFFPSAKILPLSGLIKSGFSASDGRISYCLKIFVTRDVLKEDQPITSEILTTLKKFRNYEKIFINSNSINECILYGEDAEPITVLCVEIDFASLQEQKRKNAGLQASSVPLDQTVTKVSESTTKLVLAADAQAVQAAAEESQPTTKRYPALVGVPVDAEPNTVPTPGAPVQQQPKRTRAEGEAMLRILDAWLLQSKPPHKK